MRTLDPGHRFALDNLQSGGETILQFFKDPALHDGDGYPGPSCQEVLRAVIKRVQDLDAEKADVENSGIIYDLRHAIAGFEARAIRRRIEKDGLEIERLPLAPDGHLLLAPSQEQLAPVGNALALLTSAVRCGEPFTSYCETAVAEARAAITAACGRTTRDSDGSGEAGQTAKQAGPKATARAEGIAQARGEA